MQESVQTENKTEILILGGGFAGVITAKKLLRKLISGFHITLVDKASYQDFHTDLYEIASTWMEPLPRKKHQYHDVIGTVAIPYNDIFGEDKDLTLVQDTVTKIDAKNKSVTLVSGKELKYDFLVIGLGSETNFFGIPNLEERAFVLKTVNDAMNLRDSVEEKFFDASPSMKILIGGGGFTGVELAAALSNFVRKLCSSHNLQESSVSVTIVEATDSILGPVQDWAKTKVTKRLSQLGVEIKLNSPIKTVEKKYVQLTQGDRLDYDILIWTAGIKANSLLLTLENALLTKAGSVLVDQYLRAKNFDNIYVLGDAGTFIDENGKSAPPTAQKAIREGSVAASNIANTLLDYPLIKYQSINPTFLIPLGGKYAVGRIGFWKATGFLAWVIRQLVSLRYFLKILPFQKAASLWWRGVSVFERNDS